MRAVNNNMRRVSHRSVTNFTCIDINFQLLDVCQSGTRRAVTARYSRYKRVWCKCGTAGDVEFEI